MRPYDFDEDFSTILLGAVRSPGVVTLSGHDRPKAWKDSPAKGHTGATTVLNGDDPAKFTASFYLVNDSLDPNDASSDFERWESFQRLIESTTNGPKPFALPIYHPDLVRNRIVEVTNGGVSGMKHDGMGGATVVVTFKEYKPPKKKAAVSPTAKGAAPAPGKPDPNAAAKAELASLLAEARKP